MIRHIVMFKFENAENKQDMSAFCLNVKSELLALQTKIPEILTMEVGLNIAAAGNAFDLVLVSDFESVTALNAYRIHPEHLMVVELINRYKTAAHVVDYEL